MDGIPPGVNIPAILGGDESRTMEKRDIAEIVRAIGDVRPVTPNFDHTGPPLEALLRGAGEALINLSDDDDRFDERCCDLVGSLIDGMMHGSKWKGVFSSLAHVKRFEIAGEAALKIAARLTQIRAQRRAVEFRLMESIVVGVMREIKETIVESIRALGYGQSSVPAAKIKEIRVKPEKVEDLPGPEDSGGSEGLDDDLKAELMRRVRERLGRGER